MSEDGEDEYQTAEDFLDDFKDSLEFNVEAGDQPQVNQEFHCLVCTKKGLQTDLIVTAIDDSEDDETQPLLLLECELCKKPYRMRLYFTIGLEVSLDFMRRVQPVKPSAPVFEMPKRLE